MSIANGNSIAPQGSSWCAYVGGKPTGLAGCTQAPTCPRASQCLRADERLVWRDDMSYGKPAAECPTFIPN